MSFETLMSIAITLCLLGIAALAIAMVILSRYVKDHLQWHLDNPKKRPTTVCDEGSCDVRSQSAYRQAK